MSPTLQSTPGPCAIRPSGPVSTRMLPLSHTGMLVTWALPSPFPGNEIILFFVPPYPPPNVQEHWWKLVREWILFVPGLSEALGEQESLNPY